MYDTSVKKILVPMFQRIAIPMLAMKTKGTRKESMNKSIATIAQATAIPTYTGSSASHRSFSSVIRADMPVT